MDTKYYDKEYFRLKQLESRKNNPLIRKKLVYIATINGQKFAIIEYGMIISPLCDIITAKCGFVIMIFDIICNSINKPLYTAIAYEFIQKFSGLTVNLIGYIIGLQIGLSVTQITSILGVVSKKTGYLNSSVHEYK